MECWQPNVLPTTCGNFLFIISGLYGYHSNKIHTHQDYYHFQLMELLFLFAVLSLRIKRNPTNRTKMFNVLKCYCKRSIE